jgi:hypothetical protein
MLFPSIPPLPPVFLTIPYKAIDAALSLYLLSNIALTCPAGTFIETVFPPF